ncbi:hypothetical protein DPMN_166014 [Dreissena polymorpha]|uniref:Uncharacterized protein n=1 Tax=Dreissena polymorpha TaxID=45954 RepID=A0A9D4EXX7_DREPO|nr:hypothetical protein DPMN_166014 [Dreissena polymorpha]
MQNVTVPTAAVKHSDQVCHTSPTPAVKHSDQVCHTSPTPAITSCYTVYTLYMAYRIWIGCKTSSY